MIEAGAMLRDLLKAATALDDAPTPVSRVMASHLVPYGRAYRQWLTNGKLIVWANRGEVEDLPRGQVPTYVAYETSIIRHDLLTGIPVFNA